MRQFKGQARSFFTFADSAASWDCVVRFFALAIRAQAWFPRENTDEHIFEILRLILNFELIKLMDKFKKMFLFLLELEEQTHVHLEIKKFQKW